MGRFVGRGLRPVSVEKDDLAVEGGDRTSVLSFQHTALAPYLPRRAVVWARCHQSAGHAKPCSQGCSVSFFSVHQLSHSQLYYVLFLFLFRSFPDFCSFYPGQKAVADGSIRG